MIPKIIHYCWFGSGEMSVLHRRCVESWKKYCPDYELKLWTEHNSDIDNDYCREAIIQRKWAFVADWVRFDVLYREGGIYLDTDLELVRSLDPILVYDGMVLASEAADVLGTAFLAGEAGSAVMARARDLILGELCAQHLFATSPVIVKQAIELGGGVGSTVLSAKTFFPFNPHDKSNPLNARQLMFSDIMPETIGIHQYALKASWVDSRWKRFVFKARQRLALQPRWDISFAPFRRAAGVPKAS